MEAENINQDLEMNLLDNYCYKILYPDQNYKKSVEYQNWKKSITEIIGENGIEMFCDRDKIVIYKKYEGINQILNCPICKDNFYFCQKCKKAEKRKNCCTKTLIKKYLDDEELYKYMNLKDDNKKDFIEGFFILLIPFISNIAFYFYVFFLLYIGLAKDGKQVEDITFDGKLNYLHSLLIFAFLLLMSLIYMITHYIFYLSIIILSLPFKLYPIKFILGLFDLS